MPLVSVVVPTYNRAAYLPACIESILAQTFKDYEIIVVDDGSTDQTRELLEPWIEAKRIRYFRQENKGPGSARNAGLGQAAGEIIAFLDSDDLWPPDKLEWQVEYLREHPEVGTVGGGHEYIDEANAKSRPPMMREGETSFDEVFNDCPFLILGETLIRSRLIQEVGGFDEAFWVAEDLDLWLKLARRCRIMRVPRVALYYRRHTSNISASASRMYENCERVVRKHLPFVPAPDRRVIASRAYQWMYEYFGQSAIMCCKAKLRRGDGSDLICVAGILTRLIPVAVHERSFLRRILRDVFIPVRFHSPNEAK